MTQQPFLAYKRARGAVARLMVKGVLVAFPPQFLDEIRARLTLSEIVGKAIPIKKAGREFSACCPFHKEKSASFTVNDSKGFFHCFGCGAHGDVIGFTMRYERLAFPEAIDKLAAMAGLDVPKMTVREVEQASQQKTLHQLCDEACLFFEKELHTARGRAALDYVRQRGLNDDAIQRFRLGYAPAAGEALITHLKKEGYEVPDIEKVGLARTPEDGRAAYSFFRDRVIFPVTDARGRVVAFGARILSGDGPKYINSPDHPLFHKGQMLYNFAKARGAVSRGAPFIVVEGYMDVISLAEAGFGGAVAPLGTAFTEGQAELMWKEHADAGDPILCFDGDTAGQRAAARAVDRLLPLLAPGKSARFAFLPDGQDPDDLIKSAGKEAMQAVLDKSIPFVEMLFKLEVSRHRTETPEELAALKNALDAKAALIADPLVQKNYASALHDRFDNAYGWAARQKARQKERQEAYSKGKFQGKGAKAAAPVLVKKPLPSAKIRRQELILIGILRQPALFEELEEALSAIDMSGELDKAWQAVVISLSGSAGLDSEALCGHLVRSGFGDIVPRLLDGREQRLEKWTKDGATRDDVRHGLLGVLAKARADAVSAELKGPMRQGLAASLTDTQLSRVAATRREVVLARRAAAAHDSEEGAEPSDGESD